MRTQQRLGTAMRRWHQTMTRPAASAALRGFIFGNSTRASLTWNGTLPGIPTIRWGTTSSVWRQSTRDPTKGLASLDRALELKPDFVASACRQRSTILRPGEARGCRAGLGIRRCQRAHQRRDSGSPRTGLSSSGTTGGCNIGSAQGRRSGARANPRYSFTLANALAEAGQNAESEVLMDRYRQRRPTQAPRDLMRYLTLTPRTAAGRLPSARGEGRPR